MRHVGRIDTETQLPITEVTQAEFDALRCVVDTDFPRLRPIPGLPCHKLRAGDMWRREDFLGYSVDGDLRVGWRRLVIVEDSSPRVPYPASTTPSTSVSSGSGSLALVSDA